MHIGVHRRKPRCLEFQILRFFLRRSPRCHGEWNSRKVYTYRASYAQFWWNVALLDFEFDVDVLVILNGYTYCCFKLMIGVLIVCSCSSTDWKFASELFVKVLPDKVFVHCKHHASLSSLIGSFVDHVVKAGVLLLLEMIWLCYFSFPLKQLKFVNNISVFEII